MKTMKMKIESQKQAGPEDNDTESCIHAFTFKELRVITRNFSNATNFIGQGRFGPVHTGFIKDRLRPGLAAQPVAVMRLDFDFLDSDDSQSHREWLREVTYLGQLRHPNLVNLIGYCREKKHRLLVYEYMPGGTLENHLFNGDWGSVLPWSTRMKFALGVGKGAGNSGSLRWSTRMKIALGAAKGLAFLHESENLVFHNFNGSNILLDSDYNVKLSGFGFPMKIPENHAVVNLKATYGYAAPEFVMTGHLTKASNMYGFGVVLLELLTGRRAIDMSRPPKERGLVHCAHPQLKDHQKLQRIIDPRLRGMYSKEGSQAVALLAYDCLSDIPRSRPTVNVVVATLKSLKDYNDVSMARGVCTCM